MMREITDDGTDESLQTQREPYQLSHGLVMHIGIS